MGPHFVRTLVLAAFSCGIITGPVFAADTEPPSHSIWKRPPAIFMVGDSTMSIKPLSPPQPERGWGQMLPLYFRPEVKISDVAMNGRSSKSFRDEGRWDPVLKELRRGDYVIIQFGHNDEKQQDPKRYTEPFGSFKQNLERYVREVRQKHGNPVLATPVARRAFTNQNELRDTHGDYARAVRQVAAEQKVPLLDLQRDTTALLQELGPERSKKMFMWFEPGEYASIPDGRKDDTHFNAYGASRVCDLAVEEMKTVAPELAAWLISPARESGPSATNGAKGSGSKPPPQSDTSRTP
jgi:lysophospholipase L1-like esterase